MAAGKGAAGHVGKTAEGGQSCLFLPRVLKVGVHAGLDVIDDKPGNPAVPPEGRRPLDLSRQGQSRAGAVDDEDDGRIRDLSQIISTGLARRADAVVIAHGSFQYGDICAVAA